MSGFKSKLEYKWPRSIVIRVEWEGGEAPVIKAVNGWVYIHQLKVIANELEALTTTFLTEGPGTYTLSVSRRKKPPNVYRIVEYLSPVPF